MTVAGSPTDNQSAISMNNLGASLIVIGNPKEAVTHLTNALSYSKSLTSQATVGYEEADQSSEPRFDAWICQACTFGRSAADVTGSFVYSQPIIIPTDDTPSKFETNLLMTTSAIVFNMAIAHHLSGIQQGNDPRLLQKAVLCYEYSFNLSEVYRNKHTGSCMYYTMAVLNNLGVCHRSLGQGELADKKFSILLTSLLYVQTSPQKSTMNLKAFFGNVLYLALPSTRSVSPAPAA
jgi:hypothetical protein